MADRHDLDITISADGEVEITVKGVDGPRCVTLTKELEEELGLIVSQEKTSEYYKQEGGIDTHIDTTS